MNEEALFQAALERPTIEARHAFLRKACASDAVLFQRLLDLLAAHEKASGILEHGAAETASTGAYPPPPGKAAEAESPEQPGTLLDSRYKLLELIGEGGMGTVWMAHQTEPIRRLVAVKLIKPGMDSKAVLARFEAERQALALMDHPNIAKVHDAGTTLAAKPFFVMELVKGVPITRYCDEHCLTPRQRLELFVPVCHALQHAHQKGIIHRDLKPSNVLVALYDDRPVPKVIDFGVAKAAGQPLTEETLHTGFGAVVGTVEYMSPEQANFNQLDVDTRSDIYSLGVLLYELLTGTTPLPHQRVKESGILEALRIIREEEAPTLSSRLSTTEELQSIAAKRGLGPAKLTKLVKGELDWIVKRALEKDRSRRYDTAGSLAADIQRYLNDEPVQARPPSAAYRFHKFVRKNKVRLTMAGLVVLILLTLAGSLGWFAFDRAARRTSLHDGIKAALEEGETRRLLALSLVEQRPYWKAKLAEAKSILRHAQSLIAGDENAVAEELRARYEDLAAKVEADDLDCRLVEAIERIWLDKTKTNVAQSRFSEPEAAKAYEQLFQGYGITAYQTSPKVAAELLRPRIDHKHPDIRHTVVGAFWDWFRQRTGTFVHRGAESPRISEGAWAGAVALALSADPWGGELLSAVKKDDWTTFLEMARQPEAALQPTGLVECMADLLKARKEYEAAQQLLRRAQQLRPNDFWINQYLAKQHLESVPPRVEEAIAFYRVCVALRPEVAGVRLNYGESLRQKGDLAGALEEFRKASQLEPNYAGAHNNIGIVLLAKKDYAGALAALQQAVACDPTDPGAVLNLGTVLAETSKPQAAAAYRKAIELSGGTWAKAYNNLGAVLDELDDLPGAIMAHRKAIELQDREINKCEEDSKHHQADHLRKEAAGFWSNLGGALRESGDLEGALKAGKKAVELNPQLALAHYSLGISFQEKKDRPAAIACFRKAIDTDPRQADFHYNLGVVLFESNDVDGAVAAYKKALAVNPGHVSAATNLGRRLMETDPASAAAILRKAAKAAEAGLKLVQASEAQKRKQAITYHNLANALVLLKDISGAIEAGRKALELNSKDGRAYGVLGLAYKERGDFAKAIEMHRKAVDLEPQWADGHNNLGHALYYSGQTAAAIVALRKAIELDPNHAMAHGNLGLALAKQGRFEDGERACRKSIALNAGLAETHNNLGLILTNLKKFEEAIKEFHTAITCNKFLPQPHSNLGAALTEMGRFLEAEKECRIAIAKGLDDGLIRYRLAMALYGQKKYADTEQEFRRAVGHDPNQAQYGYALGKVLSDQGKFAEAESAYRAALPLAPKTPELHCNLGWVLKSQGRYREALKFFEQGHELGRRLPGWKYPSARWLNETRRLADFETKFEKIKKGGPPPGLVLFEGKLAKDDPPDRLRDKSFHKVHEVDLEAGKVYVVHLASPDFDPFLRLEDAKQQVGSFNDDGGPDDRSSRLAYAPEDTGKYRLIVTSFGPAETGRYFLSLQGLLPAAPDKVVSGKLDKESPRYKDRPAQTHPIMLATGAYVVIKVNSKEFPPVLILKEADGKVIAQRRGSQDKAMLLMEASGAEELQAVVTASQPGASGNYSLTTQQFQLPGAGENARKQPGAGD